MEVADCGVERLVFPGGRRLTGLTCRGDAFCHIARSHPAGGRSSSGNPSLTSVAQVSCMWRSLRGLSGISIALYTLRKEVILK